MEITSPSDGKKIARPDVLVQGTISNPAGNEAEVKVNGVAAIVYENQFIANHVPLQEGKNKITATVTDIDGKTATTSVVVEAEPTGHYIKISADTELGNAPLETALTVEGAISLTEPFLTYTGPGKAEFLEMVSTNEYGIKITKTGVYFFTAEVIDTKNNLHYTDTIAIVVFSTIGKDS